MKTAEEYLQSIGYKLPENAPTSRAYFLCLLDGAIKEGFLDGLEEAKEIAAKTRETIWHCDGLCPKAIQERIDKLKKKEGGL